MQKQKVADGPRFLSSAYHALCKTGVLLFLEKKRWEELSSGPHPATESRRSSTLINKRRVSILEREKESKRRTT
jgi:hypothetical protein